MSNLDQTIGAYQRLGNDPAWKEYVARWTRELDALTAKILSADTSDEDTLKLKAARLKCMALGPITILDSLKATAKTAAKEEAAAIAQPQQPVNPS